MKTTNKQLSLEQAAAVGNPFGRRDVARAKANPDARSADVVQLDQVIHERTRLAIITALFTSGEGGCSFSDLRDTLALTDGNLLTHLRTLEDAGYVARIKEGSGRNSNTTVTLSTEGGRAFKKYLDQLESLVRTVRGK